MSSRTLLLTLYTKREQGTRSRFGVPKRGIVTARWAFGWLGWILLFQAQAYASETLHGRVVRIADGDTLTVLDDSRVQHRVRLAGIDAPERAQAFGNRSRQSLGFLVMNKYVVVEYGKSDRYGRIVGKVLVARSDANLAQIQAGMAWHYKEYQREQTPHDVKAYAEAEAQAREKRAGLWADKDPIPPWSFRKAKRN